MRAAAASPTTAPAELAHRLLHVDQPSAHGVDHGLRGAGDLVDRPGDELHRRRLAQRAPGVLRHVPRLRACIQDDLPDVDGGDPVDHRVVGLGEDGEPVVLEALDEVHLPQRAGPVQRPAHDPRDQVVELVVGTRARQRRAAHVVGHVEVLVVDPDRVGEVAGHPAHALAVARDEGDPVADQPDEALVVEPALGHLEDRHAAHVHRGGRLLHVQEGHVQRAQAVTHHVLLASQSLSRLHGRPNVAVGASFILPHGRSRRPPAPVHPGSVHRPRANWEIAGGSRMLIAVPDHPSGSVRQAVPAPSSSGPGPRPFTAVARVRIPLGIRPAIGWRSGRVAQGLATQGPVAQLVSAPPCHGGGRGFESRRGRSRRSVGSRFLGTDRPGSSVGTSVRLKIGRSAVRPRPWPLRSPSCLPRREGLRPVSGSGHQNPSALTSRVYAVVQGKWKG